MMPTLKIKATLQKESDESDECHSDSGITKTWTTVTKQPTRRSKSVSPLSRIKYKNDTDLARKNYKIAELPSKRLTKSEDKTGYVPAINLHDAQYYQQILEDIKKYVKKEFSTKLTGSSIKIMLTDQNDFDRLTAFYKKKDYSFHICRCNNDANLAVAIKGVPHSLSIEEVQTILDKKYPVVRINRVINKINRRPTSTCYVEVTNSRAGRKILKMEHLFHTQVTVELWKSDKAMPCKNCQKYSVQKISITVCTKCKGNHSYLLCPLRKTRLSTQSDKCSFCESYHTDYKNCPYYEKLSIKNDHKTIDFHTNIAPKQPTVKEETKLEEKVSRIIGERINFNGNNNNPIISNEIMTAVIFVLIAFTYCLCWYVKST